MLDNHLASLTLALFLISGGKKSDGSYTSGHVARAALLTAMGISYIGSKIPKDAEGTYIIQGITFRVARHVPKTWAHHGGARKTSKHRVFVKCPVCDKEQPIGRLGQHAAVHGWHRTSTFIIADQPALV